MQMLLSRILSMPAAIPALSNMRRVAEEHCSETTVVLVDCV